MSDYGVTIQGLKKIEELIGSGQPVSIELRNENWEWSPVEALVSYEPIEDGVEVDVVCEGGPQSAFEKPVYVKVMGELDDDTVITKYDITKLSQD